MSHRRLDSEDGCQSSDGAQDDARQRHRALLSWAIHTLALPSGIGTELGSEIQEIDEAEERLQRDQTNRDREAIEQLRRSAKGRKTVIPESAPEPPEPRLKVLERAHLRNLEESAEGDNEMRRRNTELLKKLGARGDYRALQKLPRDWNARLDRLGQAFPNFAEVISYLRVAFFAASREEWPSVRFRPLLILGNAGVGKTMFTERLANMFDLPFVRIDMASAQSASALTGSDVFWSNTRPGRLFAELGLGRFANPLIQLDELDKAHGDERYPATAGLYGLLEERTAAQFADLSVPEVPLDASRTLWVSTANDVRAIDGPLLDRMRVFHIPRPSADMMRTIVLSALQATRKRLRIRMPLEIDDRTMSNLVAMSPRAAVRAIDEAVVEARMKRNRVLKVPLLGTKARQRVGFWWTESESVLHGPSLRHGK